MGRANTHTPSLPSLGSIPFAFLFVNHIIDAVMSVVGFKVKVLSFTEQFKLENNKNLLQRKED